MFVRDTMFRGPFCLTLERGLLPGDLSALLQRTLVDALFFCRTQPQFYVCMVEEGSSESGSLGVDFT